VRAIGRAAAWQQMLAIGRALMARPKLLLFIWLISGAAGSWPSERKGYGERTGLTLGLPRRRRRPA